MIHEKFLQNILIRPSIALSEILEEIKFTQIFEHSSFFTSTDVFYSVVTSRLSDRIGQSSIEWSIEGVMEGMRETRIPHDACEASIIGTRAIPDDTVVGRDWFTWLRVCTYQD